MDIRKIALLFGALVIAGVTAFMARSMFTGPDAVPTAAATATPVAQDQVLVALRTLPVGTIIDDSAVRAQSWPKDMIDGNMLRPGGGSLTGRVVRYAVAAGQPLTNGALVKPGDRGFLAAALGPGMRAITVPVTANSGGSGFVFPGDRVDVLLTQEIKSSVGGPMATLRTAETIVRNVRVLATDQNIMPQGETKDAAIKPFTSATLEATPRIAEKIAVAQTIGTISLSLRSIADNAQELDTLIASGDVQVPADAKGNPKAEKAALMAYAAAPSDLHATATTGGEVSRFQRSTRPVDFSERQAAVQDATANLTARVSMNNLAQQSRDMAVTVRRGSASGTGTAR